MDQAQTRTVVSSIIDDILEKAVGKAEMFRDSLLDYSKSVAVPILLQALVKEEKQAIQMLRDPRFPDFLVALSDKFFFAQKDSAVEKENFARYTHMPFHLSYTAKTKDGFNDVAWHSAFMGNISEIAVPEDVAQENGEYRIVERLNFQELKKEGVELSNCVATYASKCCIDNMRIFSMEKKTSEGWKRISTLDFSVDCEGGTISWGQHSEAANKAPSEHLQGIHQWFKEQVENGVLQVNYEEFRQKRNSRLEKNDLSETVKYYCGFDALNADTSKSVAATYKKNVIPKEMIEYHNSFVKHLESFAKNPTAAGIDALRNFDVEYVLARSQEAARESVGVASAGAAKKGAVKKEPSSNPAKPKVTKTAKPELGATSYSIGD